MATALPTLDRLDPREFQRLNVEFSCWRLSQLLHGEEGAMLACSQLVDMVPGNDAKFFQATQVVDEARHAEVLSRYLLEKCDGRIYPMTGNIKRLFDYILGNGKWFIKTVGLQLLAETFAVSLFRMLMETAKDPLLRNICKRILADESRHMGFSILSLPDEIRGLSAGDLHELEDFTREASDPRDDRAVPARGLRSDGHERGRYRSRASGAQGNRARQRVRAVPQTVPPRDASDRRQQHAEGRAAERSHVGLHARDGNQHLARGCRLRWLPHRVKIAAA